MNLMVDQIQFSTETKSEAHPWFHRSTMASPWSANPVSSVLSVLMKLLWETREKMKHKDANFLTNLIEWFPCLRASSFEGTAVLHFIHNLLVIVDLRPNSKGSLVNLDKFNNSLCQFVILSIFDMPMLPQCSYTLLALQPFIDISCDFV